MAEVCFSCGYRDSVDGDPCAPCMEKRAVEDYLQKDQPVIQQRQKRWGHWTSSPEALRERQRRHRLREKVQPKEPAHPNSDPWELGAECIEHLQRARSAAGANLGARHHFAEAQELVKQLAWGPQSLPKAERKIDLPPGKIGMHNRWHVKEGKPCNCPPPLRPRPSA